MAASRAVITASPGQQPPPQQQQQHGTKRPADTTLQHEQRLSKRFDLLNIDSNGQRLYIPVSSSSDAPRQPPKPVLLPTDRKEKRKLRSPPDGDSLMEVEDSPHKVYIHDLAAELSDVESDDEHPVFLSDIEKHLSKIPAFILASPEPKSTRDNQLVLYNVPSSLSVPEEKDSVRKAIVEARARMREKQGSRVQEPALQEVNSEVNRKEEQMSAMEEDDPDAMELDEL